MQSRVVREGSVGLLLLLGLGIAIGIVAWLRGAHLGGQYSLEVEMSDAIGLDKGSPVKYRGVKVGRVRSLTPSVYGVTARIDIAPASFVIPRNSDVSVTQSGFIGQVELSIQPNAKFDKTATYPDLSPFKPKCEKSLILCDGDRLSSTTGANFDELIRSTTKLTNLLSDSKVIDNANTALKTLNTTALSVNLLSRNANKTLKDVSLVATGFTGLSRDARQQLQKIGPTAGSVTKAADSLTGLVRDNRTTLIGTLGNLQDASKDLKVAVKGLSPILSRVENGKLLDNLETLAENGAKASANLKTLSTTLNNPVTLLGLAQTLDSARVTFQNTQKITTDLEQVTGDPKLRQNIIRLINGLSNLLSSTQSLDRQVATLHQEENTFSVSSLSALQGFTPQSFTPQDPAPQYFGRLTASQTFSSNLFSADALLGATAE
ncbi:MlaD family protein [Altericista sp. CCNU0014]|uniref:MlaD family protein n=1 Tax=Altericista sp. CCNU0014 TaxID=3082949 RepID=UPI003850EFA3